MAEARRMVALAGEPRGTRYRALLDYAVGRYPAFLLVVRPELALNARGRRIRDELSRFLRRGAQGFEWPGTRIFADEPAAIGEYALNDESVEILKNSAAGLFDWQQPDRPEDLCILRGDGSPWLVCVAHEADAYFEVTAAEAIEMKAKLGDLLAD